MAITLPVHTASATHCTAGLSGYPAVDIFGSLGEDVFIGEGGTVSNSHLIPWHTGFGGWTFYFEGDSLGFYFVTHLDEGFQIHDGRIAAGTLVGHLTRSAAHAAMIGTAHVHVGNTTYTGPGLNCGTANIAPKRPALAPKHDTPHTQFGTPPGILGPAGITKMSVTEAWTKHLTYALGRTMPHQDHLTRNILRQVRRAVR